MYKFFFIAVISLLLVSCKSSSKFTGFSYDPPGVTNTSDKITTPQKRRIIGAGTPKIWVSNEFESARLTDFYQINETTFEVLIQPENAPINNSAWYAFQIWTNEPRAVYIRLNYKSGKHRYIPKIVSQQGSTTYSHNMDSLSYDTTDGVVFFPLYISETPQVVSAHFLQDIKYSDLITETRMDLPSFVSVDTIGYSKQNRAILELTADESEVEEKTGVLILLSRQHPPEVSGYRAYQAFWDELTSGSELAQEFRKRFIIKAYPIINPDGVVNGHWRHNVNGIDLNRDWVNFNQPETRAVRDALLTLKEDEDKTVYYGIDFHSTNENILYPINEEIITSPDNITQRWGVFIKEDNPDLNFVSEEFDTSSPISKNWLFNTFGSDAVTFEVEDELDVSETEILGQNAAQSLMRLLIEEWNSQN